VLYRADVRAEIEKLRSADNKKLAELNLESTYRRISWYRDNHSKLGFIDEVDKVTAGYMLLLKRFNITEAEAPIADRTERKIIFHSKNFCPTLEACKILGLDTRTICRNLNEGATNALVKQIDPHLKFCRNYQRKFNGAS
jgi:hypothetical protein